MDSADVKAFFERVSGDWDSMRSSFYNEKVIDALVERAEVTTTSTVVDVGTGTGFVAAGLAPRAAAVLGVDNSPAMLAVAEQNLRALNVGNVDSRRASSTPSRWTTSASTRPSPTWCCTTPPTRPRC